MTREDFSDFITAIEHRFSLRKELFQTKNLEEIIFLAKKYGFKITKKDFEEEALSDLTENWFRESKIYPTKTKQP